MPEITPTPTPTLPQIATIIIKNYTALEWSNNNPKLFVGEFGYENDTGKLKVGDGNTHWNLLPYICKRAVNCLPTN